MSQNMSRKQLQELIRSLQEFYACPSCSTHYRAEDIKVLGQMDSYCFVQLGCSSCSIPVLATVAATMPVASQVQQGKDVRAAEARKFAKRGAITALEIADFHQFISGYTGRLTGLAPKRRSSSR